MLTKHRLSLCACILEAITFLSLLLFLVSVFKGACMGLLEHHCWLATRNLRHGLHTAKRSNSLVQERIYLALINLYITLTLIKYEKKIQYKYRHRQINKFITWLIMWSYEISWVIPRASSDTLGTWDPVFWEYCTVAKRVIP